MCESLWIVSHILTAVIAWWFRGQYDGPSHSKERFDAFDEGYKMGELKKPATAATRKK